MRESESIAAVLDEFADAANRGDAEAMLALHSSDPRALLIGTDEGESYDFATYAAWVREHVSGFRVELSDDRAYEEGDVGWIAAVMTVIAGDRRMTTRLTGVLHREDGRWKFVQRHVSVGEAPPPSS
jgi:ketosteroid isomerase-like protein